MLKIILGVIMEVKKEYWVRMRMKKLRNVMELIKMMNMVIKEIVIVLGYMRIYNQQ